MELIASLADVSDIRVSLTFLLQFQVLGFGWSILAALLGAVHITIYTTKDNKIDDSMLLSTTPSPPFFLPFSPQTSTIFAF